MGPLQLVKERSASKPNPKASLLLVRRAAIQTARNAMTMPARVHSQPGKLGGMRNKSGGAEVRLAVVMDPMDVAAALAPGDTLDGVSAQAAGAPEQASATAPVKPPTDVTVTVKGAGVPAATVAEAGDTETVKSGVPEAVPEPVRLTVCWRLPLALVS